jgi:pseudouridine-5'-phosphate glycosidase
VVSAGAKAILDLPRTLEYLETQGVPVLGFQTGEFPAFYSRSSGCPLDLRVDTPSQAARIYRIQRELEIHQGILVANPVPASDEIPSDQIRRYLRIVDKELRRRQVQGKELTPFLLSRLVELSKGATLSTNVKLLENNVRLAAEIAVCLRSIAG